MRKLTQIKNLLKVAQLKCDTVFEFGQSDFKVHAPNNTALPHSRNNNGIVLGGGSKPEMPTHNKVTVLRTQQGKGQVVADDAGRPD